jgi:O-antigen chain-terminating methyltransferase
MREETRAGNFPLAAEKGILRQIREEMQRSYKPREGNKLIEQAETGAPSSGELVELRSAIAALNASYAVVGQTPPEPPTLRGRIGARLVKLVQRLLFWYTPQIVHFQYSALKAFDSALRAFEGQAKSVRQLEAELIEQQEAGLKRVQRLEAELIEQQEAGLKRVQRLETVLIEQQEAGLKRVQRLEAELIEQQEAGVKRVQQLETAFRREQHDLQATVATAMARTQVLERRLEALRIQALARLDREITRLRAQQTVQEGRVALLIQARTELPELPDPGLAQRLCEEQLHDMDALYAALEDEFRGSRQEIKERLSIYVPKLTEAGIGGESMPILDVGCGRGEWLELLREQQLQAAGVDLNRVVLAMCRERGLPVMEAEAIEHLRSLPEASLGAVTAFHVIEHLALPQLLDLLDASRRALKPGGVAIFETPNPNNVFVSSRYFYLDPTHRHPIPPLLGRFLAEARGFERVEILELHPWPEEHRVDTRTGGDVAARFNQCFYGPQDYAIIGWKAGERIVGDPGWN